jgi:hypothetical protein
VYGKSKEAQGAVGDPSRGASISCLSSPDAYSVSLPLRKPTVSRRNDSGPLPTSLPENDDGSGPLMGWKMAHPGRCALACEGRGLGFGLWGGAVVGEGAGSRGGGGL